MQYLTNQDREERFEKAEAMTTTTYAFGDYHVSLNEEDNSPLGQLEDLHICHLGMRFISAREIPPFSIYEFNMSIRPLEPGQKPLNVKCCGVVVSCEPEGNGYRTVIHFSDLGQSDANCLETITRANKMRCDYCANC
jgi:hypothetical protein